MEMVEFGHTLTTWQAHNVADGSDERCFGRIFRLSYEFGYQHIYCDQPCCDRPREQDPETGEHYGGRHHVKCLGRQVMTDIYRCIDCGRVGRRASENVDDYSTMQKFAPVDARQTKQQACGNCGLVSDNHDGPDCWGCNNVVPRQTVQQPPTGEP